MVLLLIMFKKQLNNKMLRFNGQRSSEVESLTNKVLMRSRWFFGPERYKRYYYYTIYFRWVGIVHRKYFRNKRVLGNEHIWWDIDTYVPRAVYIIKRSKILIPTASMPCNILLWINTYKNWIKMSLSCFILRFFLFSVYDIT